MIAQIATYGYGLGGLLLVCGMILLVAEALLPTHGMLGIFGVLGIAAGVVVCSRENIWVGVGLTLGFAAAIPFAWAGFVKLWPKTPVGKRLVLPTVAEEAHPLPVRVGQSGVTLSELRPMGLCDFEGTRVEAMSEHGIVPAGAAVRIVALVNNHPLVRVGT